MTAALGVVAVLIGSLVVVGQLISVLDFERAQRLGLQEPSAGSDRLHRRLELSAARWDVLILWILVPTGIAMLIDTSWWPWLALISGGAYVDAGGREASKVLMLRTEGVRVGTRQETRVLLGFHALMVAVGVTLIAHALVVVI